MKGGVFGATPEPHPIKERLRRFVLIHCGPLAFYGLIRPLERLIGCDHGSDENSFHSATLQMTGALIKLMDTGDNYENSIR